MVSMKPRAFSEALGQSPQWGQGAEPLVRAEPPVGSRSRATGQGIKAHRKLNTILDFYNPRNWLICPEICFSCKVKNCIRT